MKTNKAVHILLISLTLAYLLLPLLITFVYSVATDWYRTVLPEGYTFNWYKELFLDPRFLAALERTIFVCTVTIVLSLIIMLPTIFVINIYFPKLERVLRSLAMLPYTLPGVVVAVALLKIYSDGPLVLSGTVFILIGAFFIYILPYMYLGVTNSLRTVDTVKLIDAAELLGAGKLQAFRLVVLPNVLPGILVSTLLSFSMLFGEFVMSNLLVGGSFEVVQVYLMRRMNENGHLSSAVVVTYFMVILVISGIIIKLGRMEKERQA